LTESKATDGARIELNSPSNKSCEICPLRRSVQSCKGY
jgi:hypothetical protein